MSEKPAESNDPKSSPDEQVVAGRAVAFGDGDHDEKPTGGMRPKGVEMKREVTQEARELSAAGYEHLEEKAKKRGEKDAKLENVDITEHQLAFGALEKTLVTSFKTKDAGSSFGLSAEEAKLRLARDGRNVLTPPKKKSALRVVCPYMSFPELSLTFKYSIWTAF
jgi:sodium/potassium-transporting ATPase subunit alpha